MNKFKMFFISMVAWAVPSIALAQDLPPEGFEILPALIAAAQGGQWSLFASMVIMLLVWLATKAPLIKDWIKGEARIWTAAVAGILASFAAAVYVSFMKDGSVDWLSSIVSGLSVGLAAGGLWSLVGRKLAGQPVDADGDGVLDPVAPEAPKADDESK